MLFRQLNSNYNLFKLLPCELTGTFEQIFLFLFLFFFRFNILLTNPIQGQKDKPNSLTGYSCHEILIYQF